MPAALADVGKRLEDAGYTPATRTGKRAAKGSASIVRVLMHDGGAVFVLEAPKGMTRETLAQQTARSRRRLVGDLVGTDVYVASAGPDILSGKALNAAQVAEFHEIVDAVSDQG